MLSYEKIVSEIENCKGTQLLGFFNAAVGTAIRNKIFTPGGAAKFVDYIEQRILKESGSGQNVQQHAQPKIITLQCGKCFSRFTLSENSIHRRCGLNGCDGVLHKTS